MKEPLGGICHIRRTGKVLTLFFPNSKTSEYTQQYHRSPGAASNPKEGDSFSFRLQKTTNPPLGVPQGTRRKSRSLKRERWKEVKNR
jgi:hypothetical protein